MNWVARGLADAGSDNWLVCTRFHIDMKYSSGGEGMGTRPWYSLRHSGTGLVSEEGVGGEPQVEERACYVPELSKGQSDTFDQ